LGFKTKKDGTVYNDDKKEHGKSGDSPNSNDGSDDIVADYDNDSEVKVKGLKLPPYQSKEWNELKAGVENRMAHDFNEVQLSNLQMTNENYYENIIVSEPTEQQVKDNFGGDPPDDEDELEDMKMEMMDEQREIMWSTLFEAKDSHLTQKIIEHQDAIINDLGLRIIDERENEAYSNGLFIGVNGAGYDFFEDHWVPLYRLFGWI
jgi:hypothetical protein